MLSESSLAILGGVPVIQGPFSKYSTIDSSDIGKVMGVLTSGSLSQFIGDAGEYFLGGPEVRRFESAFSDLFQVQYSVSVNSWTSGLWAAVGALGLEPGSEVITSPWTMAATATTLLHWNLVPVFADIDYQTFNLDSKDVEAKITKRTRAIISPDIFGQSADIESLLQICKKYDLFLVSDTAQSPMAKRNGYFAGTASHIGGFSFNYHKHIHTGEGGMLITNDPEFADRLQLLRNHGEVAISRREQTNLVYGIMGMNMRLGEIESAIGTNQLTKLEGAINSRRNAANRFTAGLKDLPGLTVPFIDSGNDHVYYVYGMKIDNSVTGVSRKRIFDALVAEGVPSIMQGYQNLHMLPLFRKQLTYKNNNIPYSLISKKRARELRWQILPVAEQLHNESFIGINWCAHNYSNSEVDLLIRAFQKVWASLEKLR
jgi:dTDP-4-amino-4,6-dideoxygalactose transaminase